MTTTTISKEFLDELLSGLKRPEYLLGDKGLMKELMARLMERMLGAELTEHLGYEPHGEPTSEQTNRRNGATRKVLKDNDGAVPIEPRAIAPLIETAFRLPGNGWQFRAGADPERPDSDQRDG
jgi:hypothetical protein